MSSDSLSYTQSESGEDYLNKLSLQTADNFNVMLGLLSSYFKSNVDGPNYARSMKIMATELTKVKITLLDGIRKDPHFLETRTDYLYQIITRLVFPKGAPNLEIGDEDLRLFLVNVVIIYLKGASLKSVKEGVELITKFPVRVEYLMDPYGNTKQNQFVIFIDMDSETSVKSSWFKNIKILVDMIKPAHTLYKVVVSSSESMGQETLNDSFSFSMSNYYQEDFRKDLSGLSGVDRSGSLFPSTSVGQIVIPEAP